MKYTAFVLRGQPFHNAHQKIIRNALQEADKVIILIGSYRTSVTIKNPWLYGFRADLIRGSMTAEENERIYIEPIRDYLYSMNTWVTSLQNIVSAKVEIDDASASATISLIGHFKDDSSFYLNWFPQWKLITQPNFKQGNESIDATTIRSLLYQDNPKWKTYVPDYVVNAIEAYTKTEEFERLKKEYVYITNYRKAWENSPFPPTFVTTDAVVIQCGHILLVRRKRNNYLALPGGFLNPNETIAQATIRELKEETKIDVPSVILEKCVKAQHVFDHPQRSLRGRIVTHASLIELDSNKPLPKVKGDDDAVKALWMPFNDLSLHEEEFYEDHVHIIGYFLNNKLYS